MCIRILGALVALLVLVSIGMGGSGCAETAGECSLIGECDPGVVGPGGSGGAGGTGDETWDGPWGDACGGYAREGGQGDGSFVSPAGTLQEAIDVGKIKGIASACACAGDVLGGEITIPPGFMVRGDLACEAGWTPTTGRATLKGSADKIAVRFMPAAGAAPGAITLRGLLVIAADATVPGGSSIAALAPPNTEARIERCELRAGVAMQGEGGEGAISVPPPTPPVSDPGEAACSDLLSSDGGAAHVEQCGTDDPAVEWATLGGEGGGSTTSFGFGGEDGQASPPPPIPLGAGGNSGLSSCSLGGEGGEGADGEEGPPGEAGGPAGQLDEAAGWIGLPGSPGARGTPGQGGGGGGGQKGKGALPGKPNTCGGGAGGAGGAGGCGGEGGKGGLPGGSSIALVMIGAKVAGLKTHFVAGQAGLGGPGGAGRPGASGGQGGPGGAGAVVDGIALLAACAGGQGGRGGDGGRGGPGQGGHSLGVAYAGPGMLVDEVTFDIPFETGTGGIAAPTLAF